MSQKKNYEFYLITKVIYNKKILIFNINYNFKVIIILINYTLSYKSSF